MNRSELLEQLRELDEITLIELLGISSEEIVDAFLEQIEDNEERLIKKFNDEFQ